MGAKQTKAVSGMLEDPQNIEGMKTAFHSLDAVRERETERQRDRETERQRDRDRERVRREKEKERKK